MLERLKRIGPLVVTDFTTETQLEDITSQEWQEIVALVNFLEPFYKVTKDLEGELYPTLSIAYPMTWQLMKTVNEFKCNGLKKSLRITKLLYTIN